jgi:hypothetical protein
MKIKFRDIGEKRWLCYATAVGTKEADEFKFWLLDTLTDRYILDVNVERDFENILYHYEVRGGDVNDRMLIALRWGGNDAH